MIGRAKAVFRIGTVPTERARSNRLYWEMKDFKEEQ